jgi:hypothetical protein
VENNHVRSSVGGFDRNRSEGMSKKRDWNKEQPHHVDDGRIVKRDWAEKHPNKVEWVKNK